MSKPLSPLDARLLRWLLHYSLQRVTDIALGLGETEPTVHRHIQTLIKAGLVDAVVFSYHARQHWYYLTAEGLSLAQDAPDRPVADERHLHHLLTRLPVWMVIQDRVNAIVQEAPEWLSTDSEPTVIRWRWLREYQLERYQSKQHPVRPLIDAALLLHRSTERHHDEYFVFWIYADLGMAGGWSRAVIAARLRQLLRYRELRPLKRHLFPLLVIFTESELQTERWHEATTDAAYSLRLGTPLAGVILNITTSERSTTWGANWGSLSTRQPMDLRDLLVSIPLDALPPGLLARDPEPRKTQRSIVRNHLQSRLPPLSTRPTTEAKEREIIAHLGLAMSQRYHEIMLLLQAHPLTSARELASFLGLSEVSLARYLRSLSGWHLIEERMYGGQLRSHLTERGLRYLAAGQNVPLVSLTQTDSDGLLLQRGLSLLQRQLHHTVGVYRFLSAIHEAARTEGDHVLWFESHCNAERGYRFRGTWHNFRPDATLLYERREGQRWLLWLEWDRATMSREQLREKMLSYANFIRSREWRRLGYSPGTPVLLFVTPERGQADRLRELAEAILAETEMRVCVALQGLFEVQGFLAPIWFQAVPRAEPEQRSVLKPPFPGAKGPERLKSEIPDG